MLRIYDVNVQVLANLEIETAILNAAQIRPQLPLRKREDGMVQHQDTRLIFTQLFNGLPDSPFVGRLPMKVIEYEDVVLLLYFASICRKVLQILEIKINLGNAPEQPVKSRHIKGMLSGYHRCVDLAHSTVLL